MTHAEKIEQTYPKKVPVGRNSWKMIITCTSCSTTTDIPMCLIFIQTDWQIHNESPWKNILWNIREQIQSQLCIPSIVLCHTCCLKYPNTTNQKKKARHWNDQTFCTFWKKSMTSHPICTYIYIYMYIGRFIIWHMLWCTLILPFFRLFLITSLTFPHSQRNTSYVRLDTVGHWWPVRTWRMGHSDIPFFKQPWWYLETTSEKT